MLNEETIKAIVRRLLERNEEELRKADSDFLKGYFAGKVEAYKLIRDLFS